MQFTKRSLEFINACPSLKQVYKYLNDDGEHNVSKSKWYYLKTDRRQSLWEWHFSST